MKRVKLTRLEVAQTLQNFVSGTGGSWDWDDFMSLPIEDEYLDRIRLRCARLDSEFPSNQSGQFCGPGGLGIIKNYIVELRRTP